LSSPRGPVRASQLLQARVVFRSSTIATHLPATWLLYSSWVFSMLQPVSSTDLAIRV
jgi:hypothetical protein